mgnify:CR=1 FL=1
MANVKRCVQCGILKDADGFRKYTYSKANNTEGTYRICRTCEAINAAYRRAQQYLKENSYSDINGDVYCRMQEIVTNSEALYETLKERGLRVPAKRPIQQVAKEDPLASITKLMDFYVEEPTTTVDMPVENVPDELQKWLTMSTAEWKDAGISPEYLQETVYESLKAKYRPQTGVNKETFMPMYDDTYKEVLNKILHRFDDYEELCSTESDDA